MTIQDILSFIGPFLAMIGAGFLIIDSISGPVRWYKNKFFPIKASNVRSYVHETSLRIIQTLPQPPYNSESIRMLIDEENNKYNNLVKEDEEESMKKEREFLYISRNRAFLGFSLIAIGSLFQSLVPFFR